VRFSLEIKKKKGAPLGTPVFLISEKTELISIAKAKEVSR
jgi:hypothetical protein